MKKTVFTMVLAVVPRSIFPSSTRPPVEIVTPKK